MNRPIIKLCLCCISSVCLLLFIEAAEGEIELPENHDYFETTEANEYDDRTLLDTFGQVAKDYLTTKLIPDTDTDCRWDWRFVRCEPYCQCDFLAKPGDYHLGRSCRRRPEGKEVCSGNDVTPPDVTGLPFLIQQLLQRTRKTSKTLQQKTKKSYQKLQGRICDPLPENLSCPEIDYDSEADPDIPLFAWQERLLCRHKIPDCLLKQQQKWQQQNDETQH